MNRVQAYMLLVMFVFSSKEVSAAFLLCCKKAKSQELTMDQRQKEYQQFCQQCKGSIPLVPMLSPEEEDKIKRARLQSATKQEMNTKTADL